MFGQYFGEYLMESNLITKSQFDDIVEYQQSLRVKLGTIAVTENLLTQKQADEINSLQTKMDKRFGDIAVGQGYLTESQVVHLLNQQGNPYLQFIQALLDKASMPLSVISEHILEFQKKNEFTNDELESIKSGDIDRIIPLFISSENNYCNRHIGLALRNIIRFIDNEFLIKKGYAVSEYSFHNLASQFLAGDHNILFGFAGKGNNLLTIANPFAKEEFTGIDEDSFDSVCEFINCINGLFASQLSEEDVDIDLLPPISYVGQKLVSNGTIYIVPIVIDGKEIDLLLSIDTAIDVVPQ